MRGMSLRELSDDAKAVTEAYEVMRCVLASPVGSDDLQFVVALKLHYSFELFEFL